MSYQYFMIVALISGTLDYLHHPKVLSESLGPDESESLKKKSLEPAAFYPIP